MKNEDEDKIEKVALSQNHQLNQLEQTKLEAENAMSDIELRNNEAKENIQELNAQLDTLNSFIGDLSLDEIEALTEISSEEINVNREELSASVNNRYTFPKLDTIQFEDFKSLTISSENYLASNSISTEDDPLFVMLTNTEVKDVLNDYKEKYGDIIPDAYDYCVIGISGLVGMICNTFFSNKNQYGGSHSEFVKEIASTVLSNSKFKETFIEDLKKIKNVFIQKVDFGLSEVKDNNPFIVAIFDCVIRKHLDKFHQSNSVEFSSDFETKILELNPISPSRLINLCVDDEDFQRVVSLLDVQSSEISEYIDNLKLEDVDIRSLIEVIHSSTDITQRLEETTGIDSLSEIFDDILSIYDLLSSFDKELDNETYSQLQMLISKIMNSGSESLKLKKTVDWLKNQISFDLAQIVKTIANQIEIAENESIVDLDHELIRKTIAASFHGEIISKDFSVYILGEKISVFNDLVKDETFVFELTDLIIRLQSTEISSSEEGYYDEIFQWAVKRVPLIIQNNQCLNLKLVGDLSLLDFKMLLEKLNVDFSKIKEIGLGYFLVEIIINLWISMKDFKSISEIKKEPFAVKSSYMLCGAHLLSNTKGFIDLAVSKNPSNINYKALKSSIQYWYQYYKESLRRDKQIQMDFDNAVNSIYTNSLL
ncbi:MAG: hypothetical protein LW688_06975 [Cryomorphaceae bacterium]|nr:hypothetical protein [Cryomorphaceae bacterium]